MAHAKYSPSSADGWGRCTKWVKRSGGSAAASEGTDAHTLLEYCGVNDIHTDKAPTQLMRDDFSFFDVTLDMRRAVQEALDYVNALREKYDDLQVWWEIKVNPSKFTGRDDMGGTSDIVCYSPKNAFLWVIDYKHGRNVPVHAESTYQPVLYTGGVLEWLEENGIITNDTADVGCHVVIIQPRCSEAGTTEFHYTDDEIYFKCNHLGQRATSHEDGGDEFNPSDKACQWCASKNTCISRSGWVLDQAGVKFGAIDSIEEQVETHLAEDAEQFDSDTLGRLLPVAKLLKSLATGWEEAAQARALDGDTISGHKLVYGRGSRGMTDDAEDRLRKVFKAGDLFKKQLKTIPQLEKIPSLTEKQKRVLSEVTIKTQGKLTLVKESDKRKAVDVSEPDLTEQFGEVK